MIKLTRGERGVVYVNPDYITDMFTADGEVGYNSGVSVDVALRGLLFVEEHVEDLLRELRLDFGVPMIELTIPSSDFPCRTMFVNANFITEVSKTPDYNLSESGQPKSIVTMQLKERDRFFHHSALEEPAAIVSTINSVAKVGKHFRRMKGRVDLT